MCVLQEQYEKPLCTVDIAFLLYQNKILSIYLSFLIQEQFALCKKFLRVAPPHSSYKWISAK